MDFSTIPHPVNFDFQKSASIKKNLTSIDDGIFRLFISFSKAVPRSFQINLPAKKTNAESISFKSSAFSIVTDKGTELLKSSKDGFFGTCNKSWVLRFEPNADDEFYGLGEHSGRFEHRGSRSQMWNVDAWGAHGTLVCKEGDPDPLYTNIPFLLLKRKGEALGILVNDAGRVFFSLSPDMRLHPSQEKVSGSSFYFGSTSGPCDVLFITGDSVADVLCKYGKLAGPYAVPPLWALGYHQSRWGYAGTKDLLRLDRELEKRKIPCDGLFLDIDYMDHYKVFTTNKSEFKDPHKISAKLLQRGRHIVPILDPGVRSEDNYFVQESGKKQGIFCKNPNGEYYRGFVWPGATLFPDFSTQKGKTWWAKNVAKFSKNGFYGYWIDMNDPSTGSVSNDEMLFGNGELSHESFHNLYANGMAEATRKGLLKAHPSETPFVLSRSASFGMGRSAGVWLGDNFSTWKALKDSIPMALGLSISGIPLVGADIGGFGEDSNAELITRWAEASVLFPFFRIHSCKNSVQQEPWSFGTKAEKRIKNTILLRYKFLPYLYNEFLLANKTSSPVMRPLFYLGSNAENISKERMEDEYLIGNSLLVAPILEKGKKSRTVELPEGMWTNVCSLKRYKGGKAFTYSPKDFELAVFAKCGEPILQCFKKDLRSSADINLSDAKSVIY
ncbi:MAG: glycoside hydrolase family 31 protein [Fibrobacteraceae bacterium]|nr:glycoside hydrolase family 31 protein [Fibrobacteraceae bacterium]